MKLPPYTIPDADADLWGCGVRYDRATSAEERARQYEARWGSVYRVAARKGVGKAAIWALLRKAEGMTIAELAAATGSKRGTVRAHMANLLSVGAVDEIGPVPYVYRVTMEPVTKREAIEERRRARWLKEREERRAYEAARKAEEEARKRRMAAEDAERGRIVVRVTRDGDAVSVLYHTGETQTIQPAADADEAHQRSLIGVDRWPPRVVVWVWPEGRRWSASYELDRRPVPVPSAVTVLTEAGAIGTATRDARETLEHLVEGRRAAVEAYGVTYTPPALPVMRVKLR